VVLAFIEAINDDHHSTSRFQLSVADEWLDNQLVELLGH
jgi:hypothetical protein